MGAPRFWQALAVTAALINGARAQSVAENPELDVYLVAFKLCTEDFARQMAPSQEPADAIVTAAFSKCSSIEEDLRKFLLKRLRKVDLAATVIAGNRKAAARNIVRVVIEARKGRPGAPVPTAKYAPLEKL